MTLKKLGIFNFMKSDKIFSLMEGYYGVDFVKQANGNLKLKSIKCSLVVKL